MSDFIFQIILLHIRFYRYDVHDTILLNHIHFGSLLVVRRRFKKKKLLKKKNLEMSLFLCNCIVYVYNQMSLGHLFELCTFYLYFIVMGIYIIISTFFKYYILLIDNINI